MTDDKFVVDTLFPTKEIHLIFGPSGAGATTLLLQIIADYSAGRPVLDRFPSHPMPFCLISCAKSLSATRRHMKRLGMDPSQIPHLALSGRRGDDHHFANVYDLADRHLDGRLKVLFIDGLSTLCDKVADDKAVTAFMSNIIATCEEHDVTVIATIRASKARSGEGYVSIRERIIGSGAFASFADTKIGIDPVKPSDPANHSRSLVIMPQAEETIVLPYALTKFGLLPNLTELLVDPLDAWLATIPGGTLIRSSEMMAVSNMTRPTFYRWLSTQLELGTLIDGEKQGEYRTPNPN